MSRRKRKRGKGQGSSRRELLEEEALSYLSSKIENTVSLVSPTNEGESSKEQNGDFFVQDREIIPEGQSWPSYVHLKETVSRISKESDSRRDIRVTNFNVSIKSNQLLKGASLVLNYRKHYGLFGRNGIGKSVLLRSLAERRPPFHEVSRFINIHMVQQEIEGDDLTPLQSVLNADRERDWLMQAKERLEVEEDEDLDYSLRDIYERMREIDAHKAEPKAARILAGLGFSNDEMRSKPTREYSGGWRMRIALAQALFVKPDVLILDEPTNHLDLNAVIWLERYLTTYPGTFFIASHEAMFLNEVVDGLYHYHDQTLTEYKGNYDYFLEQRAERSRALTKVIKKEEREMKRLRGLVQRNKGTKEGARYKRELEMLKANRTRGDYDEKSMRFQFPDPGDMRETAIVSCSDLSFGYTPKELVFRDVDFGIYASSRVALVGFNGVGKSTLMKLMACELEPTSGAITCDRGVRIARFHQHFVDQMNLDQSPLRYMSERFPEDSEGDLRTHLGRFGLGGSLVTKQVRYLSGGQKSRCVLSFLTRSRPHLLMLDEPTNHLDIDAIEALGDSLRDFEGGIVMISHNQRLIDMVCNEIWVVENQGVSRWEGDSFQSYKEHLLSQLEL